MWSTVNRWMIVASIVLCVTQMVYWFGRLPDPMPSHFDVQGKVDGYMPKTSFFLVIGLIQGLFLVGVPALAGTLKRLPNSMLNIPHKEYWLAPSRRERTLDVSAQVLIAICWLTGWLLMGAFQLTALVGIQRIQSINPEFVWIMAGYLIVVFSLVGWMMVRFRKPNDAPALQNS